MIALAIATAWLLKQDDIKDVKIEERFVKNDPEMRYFYIDARREKSKVARNLLLILPGGDGSADFQAFCARIVKAALPDDFIGAELVAPQWSVTQSQQIVWPNTFYPYPGAKFNTEDFMNAVIRDVRKNVNVAKVYALGWSSGGPPVYASALSKNTPLSGAFVAMSIRVPKVPEKISNVRFYLFQSPDDQMIDIGQVKQMRDDLTKAGAFAELKEYSGGHGWHGNVYGNIAEGMAFLQKK